MSKKISVIILCGGKGKRFDKNLPKQFFKLNNKTILEINIKKFSNCKFVNNIIIVSAKKLIKKTKEIIKNQKILVVEGGKTRQESVKNGLKKMEDFNPEFVMIHDCARPFVNEELIKNIYKKTTNKNGCIPILKINDSIKKIINSKNIINVDRNNLFLVQTPQSFPFKRISEAHKKTKNFNHTDDSSLAAEINLPMKSILGSKNNIKITTKDDIKMIESLYRNKKEIEQTNVGMGFDVHKFVPGNQIILCGVKIPFDKKLSGHSDADVVYHAIVDAILGSIGEGDIGEHFPPSEKKWKNAASIIFLEYAKKLLDTKKASIQNIDITIICEKPKIIKYKDKMKENLKDILKISLKNINLKGTTTEKLGFLGREEGIAAQVIVSVKIKNAKK